MPVVSAFDKAPTRIAVAAERRRLARALEGTQATVVAMPDGGVRIAVPLAQAFDHGSADVKAPLAIVLDRLALDQRESSTRLQIKAPTDAGSRTLLVGTERAVSARTYLEERGISPTRCSVSAAARGNHVEIVVGGI